MNKTLKWAWALLGVGGLLLAIVSIRMVQTPPDEKPDAPEAVVDSEIQDEDHYVDEETTPSPGPTPPGARNMPPIEITREGFKPKTQVRGEGIPAPRDTPHLRMQEPQGLDKIPGQKQAWNTDIEPQPESGDSGQGSWEPPAEDLSGERAPDAEFIDAPPPPPEGESDFSEPPVDNFQQDFGGGSGD